MSFYSVIARVSQSNIAGRCAGTFFRILGNLARRGVVRGGGGYERHRHLHRRRATYHHPKSQHFRSRHINLSCSGAPVFGVDGRLVAVLDVSAIDPKLSERAHALTGALTTKWRGP